MRAGLRACWGPGGRRGASDGTRRPGHRVCVGTIIVASAGGDPAAAAGDEEGCMSSGRLRRGRRGCEVWGQPLVANFVHSVLELQVYHMCK